MGSNKCHKTEKTREAKKKRHHNRSRSYTPNREKSKKHRHHKKASEYYNEEELAKFKKPKKKIWKLRTKKKLKADDLVPAEDLTGIKLEKEEDKELELHLTLKKIQRLKEGHSSGIQKIIETMKQEILDSEENQSGNIVFDSTAEYCRILGDIPTYGLAGNREENGEELMDFEMDGIKDEPPANEEEDDGRGTWNAVHLDENTMEPIVMEAAILERSTFRMSLTCFGDMIMRGIARHGQD